MPARQQTAASQFQLSFSCQTKYPAGHHHHQAFQKKWQRFLFSQPASSHVQNIAADKDDHQRHKGDALQTLIVRSVPQSHFPALSMADSCLLLQCPLTAGIQYLQTAPSLYLAEQNDLQETGKTGCQSAVFFVLPSVCPEIPVQRIKH